MIGYFSFAEVSAYFMKMNKISIGQLVQIKSDCVTSGEIAGEFGKLGEDFEKV